MSISAIFKAALDHEYLLRSSYSQLQGVGGNRSHRSVRPWYDKTLILVNGRRAAGVRYGTMRIGLWLI